MPKMGQPTRRKLDSADTLRGAMIAHDKVFLRLSNRQLGEKYGVSERTIRRIRSREEVQALEQQWEQEMFEAHRAMGQVALQSTLKLLEEGDPYTTNQYWKRMGIVREPVVDFGIKELKIECPPEIQKILEDLKQPLAEGQGKQ